MVIGQDPPREASPNGTPRRPGRRRARRTSPWPMVLSVATHLGVALIALGVLLTHLGAQRPARAPRPKAVQVVVLTPSLAALKPSPRASIAGDLPVRAKATPAPTPKPTPSPSPTPSPKPSARPSARPTARPTPKPTHRPTPKPSPTLTPQAEQQKFKFLRSMATFKNMTDEQLRHAKLPPGFKSWGQAVAMTQQLDGLPWTIDIPETGNGKDKVASAAPAASGPFDTAVTAPILELKPNGENIFTFEQDDFTFQVRWKKDDPHAVVTCLKKHPVKGEPDRSFAIPLPPEDLAKNQEHQLDFMTDVYNGYFQMLAAPPGSASGVILPSVSP